MLVGAWALSWLVTLLVLRAPSSATLTSSQCRLLGLDESVYSREYKSANRLGSDGRYSNKRSIDEDGPVTDFKYESVDDSESTMAKMSHSNLKSGQESVHSNLLLEATRRADERTKQHLESTKPSAYSNFLLSAVTSPGCHRQSPATSPAQVPLKSSPSPYLVPGYRSPGHRDWAGHQHAAPHLHNHCSRGFDTPFREGENIAAITGMLYICTSLSFVVCRTLMSVCCLPWQLHGPIISLPREIEPIFALTPVQRPHRMRHPEELYNACLPHHHVCLYPRLLFQAIQQRQGDFHRATMSDPLGAPLLTNSTHRLLRVTALLHRTIINVMTLLLR